ncbi:AIF_collapsed_G0031540.mRNA.1.CDS.1 [Saccharomyces cerevisiae]|nr:AIF_collapsed_G0031540.mRNA.1.CDS.1 [Saccharomyces cerevisiae]
MKDTIQLNTLAIKNVTNVGGIPSMLPKEKRSFGDMKSSSEDALNNNTDTYGNFIRFERNTRAMLSTKFDNERRH